MVTYSLSGGGCSCGAECRDCRLGGGLAGSVAAADGVVDWEDSDQEDVMKFQEEAGHEIHSHVEVHVHVRTNAHSIVNNHELSS